MYCSCGCVISIHILILSPYFCNVYGAQESIPRNEFRHLCSLAGRYDNPIPTRFLAPIDCLKIPALSACQLMPLQGQQERYVRLRNTNVMLRHVLKNVKLALEYGEASPKILICEARPRRITKRKSVYCTYTCRVSNTLGCFQDSSKYLDVCAYVRHC
jgi:hypothetical protein